MNHRASLSLFLAALVLLLLSSHDTEASKFRDYPRQLPEEIRHALGVLKMRDLGSQDVSVTFWSGDDASSRMENIYEAERARHDPTLTHVGINLSDSMDLFNAYLVRDHLADDPLQLLATPETAQELRDTYGLGTVVTRGQRRNR